MENESVDVNQRDRWDSTPLYYSCLAGNTQCPACQCKHVLLHELPACTLDMQAIISWQITCLKLGLAVASLHLMVSSRMKRDSLCASRKWPLNIMADGNIQLQITVRYRCS